MTMALLPWRSVLLLLLLLIVSGSALSTTSTDFLSQIDLTVNRVLNKYGSNTSVKELPPEEREVLRVAHHLKDRLQTLRNNDVCSRCWVERPYCFCKSIPPVEASSSSSSSLNRLFLLMHHREIGMAVDTAKLILSSYPTTCRLVVAGIGAEYQDSMAELETALRERRTKCLVLFPDEKTSRTYEELLKEEEEADCCSEEEGGWDLIVIDGTWQQARRIQKRYTSPDEDGYPRKVKLSRRALAELDQERGVDGEANAGHQLRKHSVTWRKVGTFEAARLFLADLLEGDYDLFDEDAPWLRMKSYQQVANHAAQQQNGNISNK